MSYLIKNYKICNKDVLKLYLEHNVIGNQLTGLTSESQELFKSMFKEGYLITADKNKIPNHWTGSGYKDIDYKTKIIDAMGLGCKVGLPEAREIFYWKRDEAESSYVERLMIRAIRAWDEIPQQINLFLRHNKCILVDNSTKYGFNSLYNQSYKEIVNNSGFKDTSCFSKTDFFIDKTDEYLLDRIIKNRVDNSWLENNDYCDLNNLELFVYFKPQEVKYQEFLNGKNAVQKVNVGDYFVNYRNDRVYQESVDYLGNKILRKANHPHISEGGVCAGGWSRAWNECRSVGRIFGWHSGFALFLRRYNSRSPYNNPKHFKKNFSLLDENGEKFEFNFKTPAEAVFVIKNRGVLDSQTKIENLIDHLKRCQYNNISPVRYIESYRLLRAIKQASIIEKQEINKTKLEHVKNMTSNVKHFFKQVYNVSEWDISVQKKEGNHFINRLVKLWDDLRILREGFINNAGISKKVDLKSVLSISRGHFNKDPKKLKLYMAKSHMKVNFFYERTCNLYTFLSNRMYKTTKTYVTNVSRATIIENRKFLKSLKKLKGKEDYLDVVKLMNGLKKRMLKVVS